MEPQEIAEKIAEFTNAAKLVAHRTVCADGRVIIPKSADCLSISAPVNQNDLLLTALAALSIQLSSGITTNGGTATTTPASTTMLRELTLTADNTIPSLATAVDTSQAVLFIYRGWTLTANQPASGVTVSATGALTYNSALTGVNIPAGEIVSIQFFQTA